MRCIDALVLRTLAQLHNNNDGYPDEKAYRN